MRIISIVPLPPSGLSACLGVVLVAAAFPPDGRAAESDVPRATMPLMKRAPTIDGRIDEAEWKSAVRNVGLVSHTTQTIAARRGVFWIGCDGRQLLLAMKTELPPDGRILTRAVADPSRDVVAAFHDDSIELVLDPARDKTDGTFYHLITNARGALYDWAVRPGRLARWTPSP